MSRNGTRSGGWNWSRHVYCVTGRVTRMSSRSGFVESEQVRVVRVDRVTAICLAQVVDQVGVKLESWVGQVTWSTWWGYFLRLGRVHGQGF